MGVASPARGVYAICRGFPSPIPRVTNQAQSMPKSEAPLILVIFLSHAYFSWRGWTVGFPTSFLNNWSILACLQSTSLDPNHPKSFYPIAPLHMNYCPRPTQPLKTCPCPCILVICMYVQCRCPPCASAHAVAATLLGFHHHTRFLHPWSPHFFQEDLIFVHHQGNEFRRFCLVMDVFWDFMNVR